MGFGSVGATFLLFTIIYIIIFPISLPTDSVDMNSVIAVTPADRQWVFNTTQQFAVVDDLHTKCLRAYVYDDYEALDNFGQAFIEESSKSLDESRASNLSESMKPAQRAQIESMSMINSMGWDLRIYAKSEGEKDIFWEEAQDAFSTADEHYHTYEKYV